MEHEIVHAFQKAEIPLASTLVQMLNEHFSHSTDRRGCGFTQSTRFLSTFINSPRDNIDSDDLSVFFKWPRSRTEDIASALVKNGWDFGWRNLNKAPDDILNSIAPSETFEKLKHLVPKVEKVLAGLTQVESTLFVNMLHDLLTGMGQSASDVEGMPIKPEIGSCTQAEEYFLEVAHDRVRRGATINTVVDENNQPVMVEKMNLGESHSAMVVSPIRIFGVWIPAGSLCALEYDEIPSEFQKSKHGTLIPLQHISKARFLRVTTLVVSPEIRARAFGPQLEAQKRVQMLSPKTATIDQLRDFAQKQVTGVET